MADLLQICPPESEACGDWSQVVDYKELLCHIEVRQLIARAAAQSRASLSGEQFLEFCEKALAPLGAPLPLGALVKIAQPLNARLGVKTGKQRTQFIARPPGSVLVEILCSLARHGRKLRLVTQITDGCLLEAELPSDLRALAGSLKVTVRREGTGATVEASTHIPGQFFDWGKSNRCLDQLLTEAAANAA